MIDQQNERKIDNNNNHPPKGLLNFCITFTSHYKIGVDGVLVKTFWFMMLTYHILGHHKFLEKSTNDLAYP